MNTKNKLIFCGNSSIDHIITTTGTKNIIGGSAVNSAIAAANQTDKNIAIISSVGSDFPVNILDDINIDTKYLCRLTTKSNSFVINEVNNNVTLVGNTYLPINLPDDVITDYLHVSCRKGVPFIDAINKIKARHYSLDVMWSSVKDFLPELTDYFKKADFLFCNDSEFKIMQRYGLMDIVPKNLALFITDCNGVTYQKDSERKYFSTIKANKIVSTVGAGDTFLGSFLSSFDGNNLNEAVYRALSMASLSIRDFGNIHLINKTEEINKVTKIIRNMDKCNATEFNIHNRPVLQR